MPGDEGFREIHLNGKQLVFLFMALTVVAVAIFLCGVMVGRGVRNATAANVAADAAPTAAANDVTPPADVQPQAQAKAAEPPPPAPPPPPPAEEAPAPAGAAAGKAQPATPPQAAESKAANTAAQAEFAVQVTALGDRAAAEALVRRLTAKGYPAYLLEPPAGAPARFRVRVGNFKERREADAVMRRLVKEEQFKPIITRTR